MFGALPRFLAWITRFRARARAAVHRERPMLEAGENTPDVVPDRSRAHGIDSSNRPFHRPPHEAAVASIEASGGPALELPGPATPDRAEQCLIEVLGVERLPVSAGRRRVNPAVREQTLAALDGLKQIPALQSLAQGFLRAMNQPEVAVTEVIASIEKDSALCVRVLRMANSVLVSPERRIEDLDTAVQMLGVARVRKAAQALFTLRDANRVAEGFDWRHLWIHALGTAAIAEELEQQLRASADSQVHLAALLHDVGKIVLSTIAPDAYRDVLIVAWNENGRLEELERERLGVDHREAGVMFARHNQLPAAVVAAIAHHDAPERATEHRFEVALVAIANYLAKAHGLGFSGARLDEGDGDLAGLTAWDLLAETCGFRPDPDTIEQEMAGFVAALRADLKTLRQDTA
jgi:putative nucleotidyltransferase with HDIG domain